MANGPAMHMGQSPSGDPTHAVPTTQGRIPTGAPTLDFTGRRVLIAGGSKTAGQRDSGERGREPGNADIRKSRELKQALMAEAKSGGRKGKADKAGGSKSRSGASKPKSAGKSAEKSPASSGGPRKRKAKS